MKGWWRPFAASAGIGAVCALVIVLTQRARDPGPALLLLPFLTLPLGATFMLQSSVMAKRYLRGLREAGESLEVLSDEVTWMGERRVRVRATNDHARAWRIRATTGRSAHLLVRGPEDAHERWVSGSPRKAARASALRQPGPLPWAARVAGRMRPAWRPRLALAIVAGSFAAAAVVGLTMRTSAGMLAVMGLVAAVGWFVSIVMIASYAMRTGRDAAALSAGIGAGVLFLGSTYAAALYLAREPAFGRPLAAALCGTAALGLAWAARSSRVLTSLATLVSVAAGLLLPRFFLTVGLGLGVLSMLVAWRPKTRGAGHAVRAP